MRLELLRGANGMCITLDGTRITEPKIYGIMTPIQVWSVEADSIAEIIGCERVRRGTWWKKTEPDENNNIICECSVCGALDDMSIGAFESGEVHFCWRCGAKMDGGEQNASD